MSRKKQQASESLFGAIAPVARSVARSTIREAPTQPAPPSAAPVVYERRVEAVVDVANDEEQPAPREARVVERKPDDVIVEALEDGRFLVSRLRDHGTTVAAIFFTRPELEKLVNRGQAALEVGR